jgi:hypothetical protein
VWKHPINQQDEIRRADIKMVHINLS